MSPMRSMMYRGGLRIGALPEDIVILVLKEAARVRGPVSDQWGQLLPLLATCRQWRRVALPLVVHSLYAAFGYKSGLLVPPSAKLISDEDCDGPLVSNIDLLASNTYAGHPMDLHIRAYFVANPLPVVEKILRRAQKARTRWENVTSLTINMTHRILMEQGPAPAVDVHGERIVQIANMFVDVFPNMRKLKFDAPYKNEHTSPLYGTLANIYSQQLQELVSFPPIPASAISFSSQLTRLEIGPGNQSSYQLPRAVVASLVDLTLYGMRADYNWCDLDSSSSRPIVFANLKRLWVFYKTGNPAAVSIDTRAPARLEFPVLDMLYYSCEDDNLRFLSNARLPTQMSSVRLKGTYKMFQIIHSTTLPRVNDLALTVVRNDGCSASALFGTISQIFEQSKIRFGHEILIDDRSLVLNPTDVVCPRLTKLRITAPTSAETVLAIISRFPCLQELALHNFAPQQIPAEIPADALVNGNAVILAPFATKLNTLYVEFRHNLCSPETVLTIAKYIMLRTPSLRRTILLGLPSSRFDSFSQQYVKDYPHLRDIQIA